MVGKKKNFFLKEGEGGAESRRGAGMGKSGRALGLGMGKSGRPSV